MTTIGFIAHAIVTLLTLAAALLQTAIFFDKKLPNLRQLGTYRLLKLVGYWFLAFTMIGSAMDMFVPPISALRLLAFGLISLGMVGLQIDLIKNTQEQDRRRPVAGEAL